MTLNNNTKGMNMNIDELTVKEVKQIQSVLKSDKGESNHPYHIGKNYFIRTVTHYLTGKVVMVTPQEIVLQDAAWIADTGRFHDFIKTGALSEVEPFVDDVIVGRGAVIDATFWRFELPKVQK